MRLLYIANQRLPTEKAYGIQIAKMCEAFARSGARVTLLMPTRGNQITQDVFDYYGVERVFEARRLSTLSFHWPGALDWLAFWLKNLISGWILAKHVSTLEADLVYSRDELPLYILSFLNKSKKIVFEIHNFSSSRRFFYNRFKKLGIKIVAISVGLRQRLVEEGFGGDKILVAHDAVDAKKILDQAGSPVKKEDARSRLGLPRDKKIAVYVGSFYAWKGIYVLAEAAKILSEDVLIVAVGGKENELKEIQKYLDTRRIINFKTTGYIQDAAKRDLYRAAADVLVLPNTSKEKISELYTSPLKLFSYMAARRPIVVSDLPSLREMLNESNAVLVKPDSPHDLADGIRKVISNPEWADKLSARAFADVQDHTWDKRAEKILSFTSL